MKTFDETLMEADKIVKRLGNISNRPDLRLAQTLQLIEMLFLIYSDFTNKDVSFRSKLKRFLLDNKTAEMNKIMKSNYVNVFLAEIDGMLHELSKDDE